MGNVLESAGLNELYRARSAWVLEPASGGVTSILKPHLEPSLSLWAVRDCAGRGDSSDSKRKDFVKEFSHGCISELGYYKHLVQLSWVRRSFSLIVYPLGRFIHFIHYF